MEILAALCALVVLAAGFCWLSPDALAWLMVRLSARRRYILAGREAAALEAERMRESYGLKGVA